MYSPTKAQMIRIGIILHTQVYNKSTAWDLQSIDYDVIHGLEKFTIYVRLVDKEQNVLYYGINPDGENNYGYLPA